MLTFGGALACSRPSPPAQEADPTAATDSVTPDSATPVDAPPATSSAKARKPSVSVQLRGVAIRGAGMSGNPVLEICAGQRVAPCPGIELVGDVPPELISTAARAVPVIAHGAYDGTTLQMEKVEAGAPLEDQSSDRYRNPCPEYQTALGGPVNGPETLQAEMERLQKNYDSRISGIWWDRPRQTLTIRMTGDVSEVKKDLKLKRGERLCVVGGATITRAEAGEKIERLHKLLEPTEALFFSGGYDEVSGRSQVGLEAVDAATRKIIESEMGSDVEIDAFIELMDARLEEMPLPPYRGAFPLVTNPARSSTGMMHALGRFSLHADRAQSCVYLQGSGSDERRVQPLLPFGYAVLDAPLRLVDFDGRVVAAEGETTDWGGGNVGASSAAHARSTCGAASAWSGAPIGRSK